MPWFKRTGKYHYATWRDYKRYGKMICGEVLKYPLYESADTKFPFNIDNGVICCKKCLKKKNARRKKDMHHHDCWKLLRIRSGQYSFKPPPVNTTKWTIDDWADFVFGKCEAGCEVGGKFLKKSYPSK